METNIKFSGSEQLKLQQLFHNLADTIPINSDFAQDSLQYKLFTIRNQNQDYLDNFLTFKFRFLQQNFGKELFPDYFAEMMYNFTQQNIDTYQVDIPDQKYDFPFWQFTQEFYYGGVNQDIIRKYLPENVDYNAAIKLLNIFYEIEEKIEAILQKDFLENF